MCHLEGEAFDNPSMQSFQRLALAAAALDADQKCEVVAAFSETSNAVQKARADVDRLARKLVQVWWGTQNIEGRPAGDMTPAAHSALCVHYKQLVTLVCLSNYLASCGL